MSTPSSTPETPLTGLLRPPPTGAERLPGDMLVLTSALMVLASVLWLAVYWSLGQRYSVTITLVFQVATAITLFLYLRTRRLQLYAVIQLGLILFAPFAMQWSIGSFVTASGVSLWGLLAPVGAVVVLGTRQSAPWMFAWIFMTVVAGVFDYLLAGLPAKVDMQTVSVFFVLNFAGIAVIVYTLLWYYASERQKLQATVDGQREALAAEKDRSDGLLLNILPQGVAERLKKGEPHIADGHADVTILYADVAGFTRLTESLSPVETVKTLNDIFTLFDEVGEKYGVDRIKTVGETYLAATGLGSGQAVHHTDAVANMALEMAERMREYRQRTGETVALRVGIATGPVVAGVVGRRKFLYDVWGEPVALAERLAARPVEPGIHVDSVTRRRLEARFAFDDRVDTLASGGASAPLEAWRLLGRRA